MGATQYFSGRKQAKEAAENRPTFETPQAVQDSLTKAQNAAVTGLSGEAKQQARRDIDRNQAQAYTQAGSRKAGLTGISAINQQGQDASLNLAVQDAAMMQASQQRKDEEIYRQQGITGAYQAQEWQLNEYDPNRELAARGQANVGAGIQNMLKGAITGGTAAASGIAGLGGGTEEVAGMSRVAGSSFGGGGQVAEAGLTNPYQQQAGTLGNPAALSNAGAPATGLNFNPTPVTPGLGTPPPTFNNSRINYSPQSIRSY
jgi:hypothetical protein